MRYVNLYYLVYCALMFSLFQPFRVEIDPAAIIIPGEIPVFSQVRKAFKVVWLMWLIMSA